MNAFLFSAMQTLIRAIVGALNYDPRTYALTGD